MTETTVKLARGAKGGGGKRVLKAPADAPVDPFEGLVDEPKDGMRWLGLYGRKPRRTK